MDWGLLILRLVVGLLFAGHGSQKLFGWSGGPGPRGMAQNAESMGFRPGLPYAYLVGTGEVLGGLALALGFFTPLAAAVLIALMLSAIWVVHSPHGLWNPDGLEFPLVMATAPLAVAFAGAGRYSLDGLLDWNLSGVAWGLTALVLGVAAWLLSMAARTWSNRTARSPGRTART